MVQNIVAIALIIISVTLTVNQYDWGLAVFGVGVAASLYLNIKRTLTSRISKKFGILTIVSIACWIGAGVVMALLMFSPSVFGDDLLVLINWSLSVLWLAGVGVVATVIELFRTLRK